MLIKATSVQSRDFIGIFTKQSEKILLNNDILHKHLMNTGLMEIT